MKKSIAFFCFFCLMGPFARGQVWVVERQWTQAEEKRYSDWVHKNWTQTVFTDPKSDLYGLETDCADASYAMRAYYSYRARLPFMAHTARGDILTEATQEFNHEPSGRRRLYAFLRHLFDVTDTRTLARDTFPIALRRESLTPGTLYLTPGIHTYQITDLNEYGIVTILSSTTPQQVRVLVQNRGFPLFVPSDFRSFSDGYRAFRWPNEMGVSVRHLKRAHFEQFHLAEILKGNYFSFIDEITQKLSLSQEPFDMKIDRMYENLCYFARERSVLVIRAFALRLERGERCLSGRFRDDYSTPIRDQRLRSYFLSFRSLRQNPSWETFSLKSRAQLLSVFVPKVEINRSCKVETSVPEKPTLSLYEVWKAIEDEKLVSDPNAGILERWGQKPYAPNCEKNP